MAKIREIEGVGDVNAQKLKNAGIGTVEKLLEMGAEPSGRKEISSKTGFDEKLILKQVNFADLFRIKEVASEYSELLEAAGVDTVVELSNRNPENLQKKWKKYTKKKNQLEGYLPLKK